MAPPNILYIHSHDTGRFVQPYGLQVPTPNVQLLADQGVLFRAAFCTAPTCSGSRASLLTGTYCHNNGMMGLAHRGWQLHDYGQHWVHTLRRAGYRSVLVGEQHISRDPAVIGYDEVVEVDSTRAEAVAPLTIEALRRSGGTEPWFMSVGFFETHRGFFAPTSVRDTLYSLPPENLPDDPGVRRDIASFKASARALDHGIGGVLHALHDLDIVEQTLVLCTTDHGIAFPGAKATLHDRGTGVLMIIRGPGFTGGKVIDAPVTHLDVFPTLCELAAVEPPEWLRGSSLMPLVRGEVERLHDATFAETTYHAAYEPQRSVRTERYKYIRRFDDYQRPVLANVDDSESKDVLMAAGWGERVVPRERLHDLILDPGEGDNLAADPDFAGVLAAMRERLEDWMHETEDPLLDGPIPPPPGAVVNEPWQISPDDPVRVIAGEPTALRADPTAAPSS